MRPRLQLLALSALAVALWREPSPAAGQVCIGDCQGTGSESIESLVTLVGIALGSVPLSACPHGLPDGAPVTVALLIQAVNNALGSCAGLTATPTFTPLAIDTLTPTSTVPAGSTGCAAGQHRVCHGGSGRGGGYHRTCSCVADPTPTPPVCRTASGTQIAAGTSVVLYDTATVYAPDTCASHGVLVSCGIDGTLTPAGATGYAVCQVVGDEGPPD